MRASVYTQKIKNSLKDPHKRAVFIFAMIVIANSIAGKIFPTRKQALVYGATLGFALIAYSATQLKKVRESIESERSIYAKVLRSVVHGESETNFVEYIATNIGASFVSSIIQSYVNILSLEPYSAKRIKEAMEDKTPLSLYLLAGFIVGIILALIYAYKVVKLTANDIKEIIKYAPTAIKDQIKRLMNFNPGNSQDYANLVLIGYYCFMVFAASKALINMIRNSNKNVVVGKLSLSKTALMKAVLGIYLADKSKKVPLKIFRKLNGKVIKFADVKESPDQNKLDDKRLPSKEKVVLAIALIKERLKQVGLTLKVDRVFIAKDVFFNAYYDPINRIVVIIDDNRVIKALTPKEIAAIIAHELGHAYNDTFGKFITTPMLTLELLSFLVIAINKDVFIKYFGNIVNRQDLLVLELAAHASLSSWLRTEEISADAFAVKLGLGSELASMMRKLGFDEIDDLVYAADEHDIPARRLKAIEQVVEELAKTDSNIKKLRI